MTQERIFNTVAEHLLNQQERSRMAGTCAYRGYYGLQCAVGVLIKDKHYTKRLERMSVDQKPVLDALRKSGVPVDDPRVRSLLVVLQRVHDHDDPWCWPDVLDRVREEFFDGNAR